MFLRFRVAARSPVGPGKSVSHKNLNMKRFNLLPLLTLGLAVTFVFAGCKTKPVGVTTIPGNRPNPGPAGPSGPDIGGKLPPPDDGNKADRGTLTDRRPDIDFNDPANQNREKFAAQTVHFDLDSSTIKKPEQPKLDVVADYYKTNPGQLLLIEGHCDERGTEGYNLALGDRRALALREYLVNLGVSPESIHTVSFGEQKPVATGHSEAAWKQNRRGQFVLIIGK